jgi:hypothetical protein
LLGLEGDRGRAVQLDVTSEVKRRSEASGRPPLRRIFRRIFAVVLPLVRLVGRILGFLASGLLELGLVAFAAFVGLLGRAGISHSATIGRPTNLPKNLCDPQTSALVTAFRRIFRRIFATTTAAARWARSDESSDESP